MYLSVYLCNAELRAVADSCLTLSDCAADINSVANNYNNTLYRPDHSHAPSSSLLRVSDTQQQHQHQSLAAAAVESSATAAAASPSWPFRGGAFHLDSRSALVKSMERAAKQQQISDGYRALFGDLPTSTYTLILVHTNSDWCWSHYSKLLPRSLWNIARCRRRRV